MSLSLNLAQIQYVVNCFSKITFATNLENF